jgi:hypothetical protein
LIAIGAQIAIGYRHLPSEARLFRIFEEEAA